MDQEKDYQNALKLIGKSAGKICYGNVPHGHLTEIVSNAADLMWSSIRSHWILVEVWIEGSTVWESPEKDEQMVVPSASLE